MASSSDPDPVDLDAEGHGSSEDGADPDPNETAPLPSALSKREPVPVSGSGASLPDRVGPYRILGHLGEGGFGVVFRGRQRGAIRRQVALKVIKAGMDTKQVLARFDAEKNALSLMNHPHIARVLDSGTTPEGRPYFVMEYVDGTPLTTYCKREKLSLEERLRLFQQVCRGVQHAHTKGVVHRDLKPNNILVTREDGKPTPKIIDFGLAKALAQPLTEMTVVTQQSQIMGTLDYMSPEQARTAGTDVDTRTDVYSLGVILYELLVDGRPFEDLRTGIDAEIIQAICERDPPRPSQRVSGLDADSTRRIAESRGLDPHRLRLLLRRELDWIVLKALERQRDRRYETPLALAEDIDRHLGGGEAVQARPPSAVYRMRKFARRYRQGIAVSLIVFVALAVGMTWAVIERNDAIRSRDQVLRLSDIKLLSEYVAEAETIWPAAPDRIDDLKLWLEKAGQIQERLQEHELALAAIQLRDHPDLETVEQAWQREALVSLVEKLREFASDDGIVADVQGRLQWASHVDELTVSGPKAAAAWDRAIASIRDPAQCPGYGGLELTPQNGLVPLDRNPRTGLWEFWHPQSGERPVAAGAESPNRWIIGEETGMVFVLIPGGTFRMGAQRPPVGVKTEPWGNAGLRVTSVAEGSLAARAGIQVEDRLRSVNGQAISSLSEFDDCSRPLRAGSVAKFVVLRDDREQSLSAEVEVGLGSPNVDGWAENDESPVHDVTLRSYFVSKYELTQGQWSRSPADDRDPSTRSGRKRFRQTPDKRLQIPDHIVDGSHPVENVSWVACHELLKRLGLSLPTEAQWERAYRAGTSTVFWPGDRVVDLQGKANIGDATAKITVPGWQATLLVNDGFVAHAPVGRFAANGFGLHDIHGNVMEWTLGSKVPYTTPVRDEDGSRGPGPETATSHRVCRGGGFKNPGAGATGRRMVPPNRRIETVGVRPVRAIERP